MIAVIVGERAYFGMSATAVSGRCCILGSDAVIGTGVVVLSDSLDGEVYVGAPARPPNKK